MLLLVWIIHLTVCYIFPAFVSVFDKIKVSISSFYYVAVTWSQRDVVTWQDLLVTCNNYVT